LPSMSSFFGVERNCETGRDVWASFITALIVDSPCDELISHRRHRQRRRSMVASSQLEPLQTT
jgi:hypothetical protein